MKQMPLGNGQFAKVDDEDFDWLLETFGTHEVYLWIGLRDTGHEGDFEWVSGEPFDETDSGTYEKWRGRFEQLLTYIPISLFGIFFPCDFPYN